MLGIIIVPFAAATACESTVDHDDPVTASATSSTSGMGGGGGAVTTSVGAQGGAGGVPNWNPTPEQQQACTDYWTMNCAQYEQCLPLYFDIFWGDQASCVAAQGGACPVSFAPGSALTPAKLASCTTVVATLACDEWLRYFSRTELPTGCEPTPGTLADAATCISNSQCQSTYCEYPAGGASCGTCQPRGQANDPCEPGGCELGHTCQNNVCRVVGDINAACSPTAPCMVDLDCVGGMCAPALQDTDPCTPFEQQCALAHFCNTVNSQCEPIAQQPNGSACGYDSMTGSVSFCESGSHCMITNVMTSTGTCMPEVGAGGDCSGEWATGPCTLPLRCVQGTCEAYDVNACL